jgi:hypothetical protein
MEHGLQWPAHSGILQVTMVTTPSDRDVTSWSPAVFTFLNEDLGITCFTFCDCCALLLSFNDLVFGAVACSVSIHTVGDRPESLVLQSVTEVMRCSSSLCFNLFDLCAEDSDGDGLFTPVSPAPTQ